MIQILFILYTLLLAILLLATYIKFSTYIDNIEKLNKFIEGEKGYMEIRNLYFHNFNKYNNNNKEINIEK